MRKGFKIFVLTFILLTPAAIYIFLQAFGHNEFDLPELSENRGMEDQDVNIQWPDRLYDVNGTKADLSNLDEKIIILEFVSSLSDNREQSFQAKRISDIFQDETSVSILRVFMNKNSVIPFPASSNTDQTVKNITVLYAGEDEINNMMQSVLSSEGNHETDYGYDKLFLLDNEKKIRGSYMINDFDEIDRLILEVKILLKKEQHA